jgi:hypothetical protein
MSANARERNLLGPSRWAISVMALKRKTPRKMMTPIGPTTSDMRAGGTEKTAENMPPKPIPRE